MGKGVTGLIQYKILIGKAPILHYIEANGCKHSQVVVQYAQAYIHITYVSQNSIV